MPHSRKPHKMNWLIVPRNWLGPADNHAFFNRVLRKKYPPPSTPNNNSDGTSVVYLRCLCKCRRHCVSRICLLDTSHHYAAQQNWLGAATKPSDRRHSSERAAYNGNESSLPRHTLNTTQTATGSPNQREISSSRVTVTRANQCTR